jgi:hypothetical protein
MSPSCALCETAAARRSRPLTLLDSQNQVMADPSGMTFAGADNKKPIGGHGT